MTVPSEVYMDTREPTGATATLPAPDITTASRLTAGYTSLYVPSSQTLATMAGPPCPGPQT